MLINLFKNSLLILVTAALVISSAPVDSYLKTTGQRCVSLVFDDKYDAALKEADAVIKKMPKSPAGYFLKAAVYHYQMRDIGAPSFVNQFYSACDQGVKLGESSTGEWDRFFMAGVLGVRGAYERSQGRLVTSLKLGWRAIEVFRPLKDQGNIDALYGVAVYDYWVGANLKLLWWMEDAKDERPRALTDLQRVSREGIFTSKVVMYDLLEMYTAEKNYAKLETTARSILAKHPQNTAALEYLFTALVKQKKFADAKSSLEIRSAALKSRSAPPARLKQLESDRKLVAGK